jgi:CBS domain containing-hemolysin-like protein
MVVAILLLAAGVFLSAFFSGAETGFYRVTRVRLMLDALGGDWIGRGLLWLTDRPSMFVATTLVGNNLSNSLASLAVVMGTHALLSSESPLTEVLAPVVLAPLIFIYGELMPKHVFYQAPNRMLRRCGPVLLVCTLLFLPVSALLWGLSQILQRLVGRTPQPLRMVLARRELEQVLIEGHEAGILRPTQRGLTQELLAVANRPIRQFTTPAGRVPRAHLAMDKTEVLRLARRHRMPAVPVEDPRAKRKLIGYVRTIDLHLDLSNRLPPLRPLVDVPDRDTYLDALTRLMRSPEMLGRVVSAQGQTVGFITARHLSEALFRGS